MFIDLTPHGSWLLSRRRRGWRKHGATGLCKHAIELRSGGLVEFRFAFQAQQTDAFEQTHCAASVGIGRTFGGFERDLHMALGGQGNYSA
jgi:hypothetical protein